MLARVAQNLYWFARYLERAENTARLVLVNDNLMLDLPAGYTPGWQPLVEITGSLDAFRTRYRQADQRSVVKFLVADADHPGSLASSLRFARENARTLREVMPRAAAEHLNRVLAEFAEGLERGIGRRSRAEFLQRVIVGLQAFTGILHGAMSRDDAYTFVRLARTLERADMTTRIIDVRSQLLQDQTADLQPFEYVQWMSVLRSLSGYQMYRQRRRTRVNRADALEFLLLDEQFPRAFMYSLRHIEYALKALPKNRPALRSLGRLRRFLGRVPLVELDSEGLHKLIDRLQLHLGRLHERIDATYFSFEEG